MSRPFQPVITALMLLLVLSFSSLNNAFASKSESNCFTSYAYLQSKRQRSVLIKGLIKEGDIRAVKKLFWEGHAKEVLTERIVDSKFYRWLRRLNKSHHVPSLFQSKNKFVGNEDTFSTIFHIADDSIKYSKEEDEALDDVLDWLVYAQDYHLRFNQILEFGFEQKSQLVRLKTNLKSYKKESFPHKVMIPIVQDGALIETHITFQRFDDIKDYINEKSVQVKLTFAQNFADEYFQKSRLYKENLDYAVNYRRLELAYERLNMIPFGKLNPNQVQLMDMLGDFLKSPSFFPRKDAMKKVRSAEFHHELWSTLRMWKSKRVANDAKYSLPTKLIEDTSGVSPVAMFLKTFTFFSLGTGAILTPVSIIYEDNPWVQYFTSLLNNYYNDFIVFHLNLPSSALAACYKSQRTFNTEEGSTINDFVQSHLSRYTAYKRINPTGSYISESEYLTKKVELQALCTKMRLEYLLAKNHVENKVLLQEHGYRFAAHMLLIDLIIKDYSNGEDLGELLYEYFKESEILKDHKKAKSILMQIQEMSNKELVEKISVYQKNVTHAIPQIRTGEFSFFFPSSNNFLNQIKLMAQ